MREAIRKPVVAGSFYEGAEERLKKQIEDCYLHRLGPGEIPKVSSRKEGKTLGLICPHAGYLYSGPVATRGFHQIIREKTPDIVVIMGPNHYGSGAEVAITEKEEWGTPLGISKVDNDLSREIVNTCPFIQFDEKAHQREHSVEVQLPFLQYSYKENFKIIPICIMKQDYNTSRRIGETLSRVLKDKNSLIIASSDFTHYQPQEIAERQDKMAIEAILSLNPEKLEEVVLKEEISMCGPGPIMAMLVVTSLLGAKRARLLKYATSGEITGDYGAVVGYASLAIEK
ncbi:MAG: AmmeMemoRadiSam system protein B [Candidatus Aerophobetes bacterium]|nr:AmmeMemoRadiSam system protein B [Candidatus Aerophobetes bacterium]